MRIVLLLISVWVLQGCALFDVDTWNHLNDLDKSYNAVYQSKAKIQVGMSKEEILKSWGKPHDIYASKYDKEKGYENWNYYEVIDPKDVLFNGTYFHRTLRFKEKVLAHIDQEHRTQDPKNLWVFDEAGEPNPDVDGLLKAQGLL